MILPIALAAVEAMTFTADRIAADNVTHAVAATGHVVATSGPITLRGEHLLRDPDGLMLFSEPTYATTCTNETGHTHWNVTGEVEYKADDYVILRNMLLKFYEVPVFWLPYMYYPLDTKCGFSWMPGYTSRWGAYLLTRYRYNLLGDPSHASDTRWLGGATRFDMRYRRGLAVGEDLDWNLGDFGRGEFNAYYAWDTDPEDYDALRHRNWQSAVDENRYTFGLKHRWEPTERDTVRLHGSLYSDSLFRRDFQGKSLFNWKSQWLSYENSGVFWEHLENSFAAGAEVSGRLNKFYGMSDRLPEFYFDVNPLPVFDLPVNYESENRVGYLRRNPAKYGHGDPDNCFQHSPGRWAEYDAFRFDTYHRLTVPFKTMDDVLSVVPRVGYHGTFWSQSGSDDLDGRSKAEREGGLSRTIFEGGATFAGRGTGWVDERTCHVVEPYFDVLVQRAWHSDSDKRPYVFDNLDASVMWEDQFAGRARNLPYSYYGVTPGLRNVWETMDERGTRKKTVDVDVYAALQFDATSFTGEDGAHKLAEVGHPNYGKSGCYVMPGARVRWNPNRDVSLMGRAEYDSDNNRLASADAGMKHRLARNFSYHAAYSLRDYRWWDYSSTPYDPAQMDSDNLNYAKFHYVHVGFEHQPINWLAWGPYLRWDIREGELDSVGGWVDYLTDCLGFRFMAGYDNSYRRIDGYRQDDDWSFGFYIYLRAFGSGNSIFF